MKKFFNERRTGRKGEKPRAEKAKERAGRTLALLFFCAEDFLAVFLIFRLLDFQVLTQPEGLFTGYKGNKTKPEKKINNLLNIQLSRVESFFDKVI